MDFLAQHARGLSYEQFLAAHATPEQRRRWQAMYDRVRLSDGQRQLLAAFVRQMPVLCVAGAWCGDCVDQCPIFARFALASPRIDLRFCDRDAHPDLADALSICGGRRVPSVLFLSEDGYEVARYGDRTLARYRRLVADQLGPSCPTGLVPPADELIAAVVAEWLGQFERAQLILRTSARLREKHGD